jgi:hypothetical protein
MQAVGRSLLEQFAPGAPYEFGYHLPPFNSVDHLHLHCFAPQWKERACPRNAYRSLLACVNAARYPFCNPPVKYTPVGLGSLWYLQSAALLQRLEGGSARGGYASMDGTP